MKTTIGVCLAVIIASFAGFASAQDSLEDHEGYIDIQAEKVFGDTEPMLEVLLQGSILRLMAGASGDKDPDLTEMLQSLKLVRVNAFAITEDMEDVGAKFAALSKKMQNDGWSRVVHVKEDDETVNVFLHADDEVIHGLVILAAEDEEAIFVNIVGDVDPTQLGKLTSVFPGDNVDLSEIAELFSEQNEEEDSEADEG